MERERGGSSDVRRAAATGNALSLTVDRRVRRTSRVVDEAERNRLLDSVSAGIELPNFGGKPNRFESRFRMHNTTVAVVVVERQEDEWCYLADTSPATTVGLYDVNIDQRRLTSPQTILVSLSVNAIRESEIRRTPSSTSL